MPKLKAKYPQYSDEELISFYYQNPEQFSKQKQLNTKYTKAVIKNFNEITATPGNKLINNKQIGGKIN